MTAENHTLNTDNTARAGDQHRADIKTESADPTGPNSRIPIVTAPIKIIANPDKERANEANRAAGNAIAPTVPPGA